MNRIITALVVFILSINSIALAQEPDLVEEDSGGIIPQPSVAHAGGAIYGYRYTNSLEALEKAYGNGFRMIEMDFEWTLDDKVVAIHDWTGMVERLFMIDARPLTLYEFKEFDTFQDLTLMDLGDVAEWLRTKEDAYIITDAKKRNVEFLEILAREYPDIKDQIIPQIYYFDEYSPVKALGYDNIILTLYMADYGDDAILSFIKENQLFALTMPTTRGYTDLPMILKEEGLPVYIHTVNDLYIFEDLCEKGVIGIYTDYFHANRLSTKEPSPCAFQEGDEGDLP